MSLSIRLRGIERWFEVVVAVILKFDFKFSSEKECKDRNERRRNELLSC